MALISRNMCDILVPGAPLQNIGFVMVQKEPRVYNFMSNSINSHVSILINL